MAMTNQPTQHAQKDFAALHIGRGNAGIVAPFGPDSPDMEKEGRRGGHNLPGCLRICPRHFPGSVSDEITDVRN